MKNLRIQTDPAVKEVFARYPKNVRSKMQQLRNLILETAKELENVPAITETLKWGEPSYLTKKGSTIRMDWKENKPEQYALYFQCTSSLVPTFKIVYKDTFTFEGNRAIVFQLNDEIPEEALRKCIATGLTYHMVKKLQLLGL